jgi:hypothetical protein
MWVRGLADVVDGAAAAPPPAAPAGPAAAWWPAATGGCAGGSGGDERDVAVDGAAGLEVLACVGDEIVPVEDDDGGGKLMKDEMDDILSGTKYARSMADGGEHSFG